MSFRKNVIQYLLRFDFSKKMIFVLASSIIASCYLFLNIAITEHSLATVLNNQQIGNEYHRKAMEIFQIIINYQIQLQEVSNEEKNNLKARVEITAPIFRALVSEITEKISKHQNQETPFYVKRLEDLDLQYQMLINNLKENSQPTIFGKREELIQLKIPILNLMQVIKNIYFLELSLTNQDGVEFDIQFDRIDSIQNTLSNILSLNPLMSFIQLIAELNQSKESINQNLNFINTDREKSQSTNLNSDQTSPLDKELENFITNLTHFSTVLNNLNLSTTETIKWESLLETSYDTFKNASSFYNTLSTHVKKRLIEEANYYHRKQLISGILLLAGIVLVLTPYLTKVFNSPLTDLRIAVEKLASGDLSVRIPIVKSDEVGEVYKSFNETANFFEQIMLESDKFATLLAGSSSEIFNTIKHLEGNLNLQEENIQAISQYSKNIAKNVLEFTNNLKAVNDAILVTADNIAVTKESLSTMEHIMQKMVTSANNTVVELSSIKNEIDKIKIVINTLVVIADQINLLSLNTAVRANNTGVKRFGFSVIADKISELADQTAFATLDMEEIIQEIISFVPKIITDIDQFSLEIMGALNDSLEVQSGFQKLLSMTQLQISTFTKIQTEMIEQTNKSNQINKSFDSLLASTQQTTKSVRSLYVEIEYLYHGTLNLHQMTKRFTESAKKNNKH